MDFKLSEKFAKELNKLNKKHRLKSDFELFKKFHRSLYKNSNLTASKIKEYRQAHFQNKNITCLTKCSQENCLIIKARMNVNSLKSKRLVRVIYLANIKE